jgi:hypothetical protein
MDMIEKHPEKTWVWSYISSNPNLTLEMIEKYSEKPWSWTCISYNPNLTMEMIEKHSEKPWDWQNISYNTNLTIDIIEKYPEKPWNWYCISSNEFKKEKEKFIEKRLKEHLSAFRIQQHWFNAKMNPEYSLCKKMVGDFYDNVIMARFM